MADEALHLVSLLREFPSQTVTKARLIYVIQKAPATAFRVKVDKDDNTLLHKATFILLKGLAGQAEAPSIVCRIIRKDPESAKKTNCHGQLALHVACELPCHRFKDAEKIADVVNALVKAHPKSTEHRDENGRLPLHCASRCFWVHGDATVLPSSIITAKATAAKDCDGCTPLHYIAKLRYYSLSHAHPVRKALHSILNVSTVALGVKSNSGNLPIHFAAGTKGLPIFKELAERSPDSLAVRNGDGKLPIEIAAEDAASTIVAYLVLHHGANLIPAGVSLSSPLGQYMSSLKKAEVSALIAKMPVEDFPSALDKNLKDYRFPNNRRDMILYALDEFMKKLRQTPATTLNEESIRAASISLSSPLSHYMLSLKKAEVLILITKMPVEDFPSALDNTLAHSRFPKTRRDMVLYALDEFTKKVRQTPVTPLDEESKPAAKAKLEALQKQVEELKGASSSLENQVGQGQMREANLEKQVSDLENRVGAGRDRESNLKEQVSEQENQLEHEKTKCTDTVSSLRAKLGQSKRLLDNFKVARGCERDFLDNHLPRNDIDALKSIAQSLNDRLIKMREKRSMPQRFLRVLLSQPQPEEEDLFQVVQALNSELAEIEDDILKANQVATLSGTRSIGDVECPESTVRKRARVSLSPARDDDDEC